MLIFTCRFIQRVISRNLSVLAGLFDLLYMHTNPFVVSIVLCNLGPKLYYSVLMVLVFPEEGGVYARVLHIISPVRLYDQDSCHTQCHDWLCPPGA